MAVGIAQALRPEQETAFRLNLSEVIGAGVVRANRWARRIGAAQWAARDPGEQGLLPLRDVVGLPLSLSGGGVGETPRQGPTVK